MNEGMKKFDSFGCDQIVRINLSQLIGLNVEEVNFTGCEITLKFGGDEANYIATWLFKKPNQEGSIAVQFVKGTCCSSGEVYRLYIRAHLMRKTTFFRRFVDFSDHFKLSGDYWENEKEFRDELNDILKNVYGKETKIQIFPFIIPA
jgi:hypothetical protein